MNETMIVTMTPNPTIDLNTRVGRVQPDQKLRCGAPSREPGGGGVNVSRAIQRLGGSTTLLYMGGGPIGDGLDHMLRKDGLSPRRTSIADWTRENLIVLEESSGRQYRFGMPGPEVTEEECERFLSELETLDPAPRYLVASGSLPPGMPMDFYARVARAGARLGARVVVDVSGPAMREAIAAGVYMLKPNVGEFRALTETATGTESSLVGAAKRLIRGGSAEVIVISLGAGGALVVRQEGSERIASPTVPIRSRVGAGDSMVAGMVLGLVRGMDPMDAARFGVAAGAAAVMTEGTELCRREDAERLYREMSSPGLG